MKETHLHPLRWTGLALVLLSTLPAAQEARGERGRKRPELKDLGRLALVAADTDRDYSITAQEWAAYTEGLGFDGEGRVSVQAPMGLVLNHVLNTNSSPGLEVADLRSALRGLDTDADGILSASELGPVDREQAMEQRERERPQPGARILRQASLLVAQAADADGDGAVTREERVEFLQQVPANRRGRLSPELSAELFLPKQHKGERGAGERPRGRRGAGEQEEGKRPRGRRGEREQEDGERPGRGRRGERRGTDETKSESERDGRRRPNALLMLGRFLDPDGDGQLARADLDRMFAELDKDGDGAIGRQELASERGAGEEARLGRRGRAGKESKGAKREGGSERGRGRGGRRDR